MRRSPKPLSRRQQRKEHARRALRAAKTQAERDKAVFRPILGTTHPHGPRSYRKHQAAVARGQEGTAWRRLKYARGEYYGRKLEALIRSGAPLSEVNAERAYMRDRLA